MVIISYQRFVELLDEHIGIDYYEFLFKILEQRERYVGEFRITGIYSKLIQNISQSREIRFGIFFEELITEYLAKFGYANLDKVLGKGDDGKLLCADQIFKDDEGKIHLIEQKMRDDHDSTKKRGQIENFTKKVKFLRSKYPQKEISASMWFVDPNKHSNRKYYAYELTKLSDSIENVSTHLFYGGECFVELGQNDAWNEIRCYLARYKNENSNELLRIPEYDISEDGYRALKELKLKHPKKYDNLVHGEKYAELRSLMFSSGTNFRRLE